MSPSQPQYKIRANSRCKTHPVGTILIFTGPRSTIANGWTALDKVKQP